MTRRVLGRWFRFAHQSRSLRQDRGCSPQDALPNLSSGWPAWQAVPLVLMLSVFPRVLALLQLIFVSHCSRSLSFLVSTVLSRVTTKGSFCLERWRRYGRA